MEGIPSIPSMSPEATDPSNLLTGQSAFWGLMGIGLNTFIQRPGRVCGFSVDSGRSLRISPIICLLDTVILLLKVVFFRSRGHDWKRSVKLVAVDRQLNGAKSNLAETWWFRVGVFFFGGVAQLVKIMASRGVPWTQTWAMAYVIDFVLLEALTWMASEAQSDEQDFEGPSSEEQQLMEDINEVAGWLARIGIFVQCCLQGYLIHVQVPDHLSHSLQIRLESFWNGLTILRMCLLAPFVYLLLAGLIGLSVSIVTNIKGFVESASIDPERRGGNGTVILLCSSSFVAVISAAWMNWPNSDGRRGMFLRHMLIAISEVATYLTVTLLSYILFQICFSSRFSFARHRFRIQGSSDEWMRLHFIFMNLFGGFVYYFSRFNPEGTFKPSWTGVLG